MELGALLTSRRGALEVYVGWGGYIYMREKPVTAVTIRASGPCVIFNELTSSDRLTSQDPSTLG